MACSDGTLGAHAVNQPMVKDSAFLHAAAEDMSGQAVTGASVTLDFVLLGEGQESPFVPPKAFRQEAMYLIQVEIYDMFDVLIKTVDTSIVCDDYSFCMLAAPVWHGDDERGAKAPAGIYYTMQTLYDAVTGQPLNTPVRRWLLYPGLIDTTDAAGAFTIPPLPQAEIAVSGAGTSTARYYKGWISLTFVKPGAGGVPDTVGTDTVNIFGGRRGFIFHPH